MTQTTPTSPAIRAAQSAGRAAGYCWMEHPSGHAHCTRPPHSDSQHVDYYNGRKSLTDASGIAWQA
ncbi:hypothetical protein PV377_02885 [Streptomyces ipomoeae]|uniref:hypothetical protein n=1 Tax=Streptomyces ipomoeae TaxID=103232 RepID=UPI0029A0CC41|nr:hypothetical protein [Streptomyces ipomoeae]MDX2837957.1 hypothetical protein [Streptomyces ipomoeae]